MAADAIADESSAVGAGLSPRAALKQDRGDGLRHAGVPPGPTRGTLRAMARVNYSFEKRKRELDRKSKKAAKAEQRAKEGGSRANDGVPLEPLTGPVIPNYADEDAKDETTPPKG